jgi:hypothetical protein
MHPLLEELIDEVIRESSTTPSFNDEDYEGWYCINTKPLLCLGCGSTVCYVEPQFYHLIIVWEEKDDKYLLKIAQKFMQSGFDPRVVTYHPYLGSCIPFEEVLNERS